MSEPVIIQGGMGAGVSNWTLAKAVSRLGQLGVVSGTALDNVLARRLQVGDLDGSCRRALSHFPDQAMAKRILDRYFIPGGKAPGAPFKSVSMFSLKPPRELVELTLAGNFVEVFLAKEGHDGLVGINYLEKIQLPNIFSIYGALLAGVDYILMGAGIPRAIPAIIDQLSVHQPVSMKINVQGAGPDDDHRVHFDPRAYFPGITRALKRAKFLAIVASEVLAMNLAKKCTGKVNGFVIEGPTAGGHNAPPRGPLKLNDQGEPIYGPKDEVDPAAFRELGLPFWFAGSYAEPEKVKSAMAQGAAGVQVGTVFAYCRESGLAETIKQQVIAKVLRKQERVYTDPVASPTGFPFKVVQLENTMSQKEEYEARPRICDLGYLRTAYKTVVGSVGYRCASEPVDTYLKKEGTIEETKGRKCVCNGLMKTIGLGQNQKTGYVEKPLVTSGDDLFRILTYIKGAKLSYSAADVVHHLLGSVPAVLEPVSA